MPAFAGGTPLGATTLEAFEKVISTNLTAVFFTVQSAVPHLNDNASIILNGSVISVLGNPGYSAYARQQGRRAGDGADHGVGTVAARHPRQRGGARARSAPRSGALRPPPPKPKKAFEKRIARSTPLGRIGEPDHISKTVLFLASDDAAHVQGQEIVRRRRRDGLSERCADLSGLGRQSPALAAGCPVD